MANVLGTSIKGVLINKCQQIVAELFYNVHMVKEGSHSSSCITSYKI